MGEVVNLNKTRKAKRRAEDKADAAANRVKFGRTAAERAIEKARADKFQRGLDSVRLDTGSENPDEPS
jgi:Domain of unknown function (DUF4169)